MSQQTGNEEQIRRYLLGELSDEEQQQIEGRLLSDDDFYQQVLAAENDLIYDFVCDELPEQEESSFRRHVLPNPERRGDVKFASALRKYVRAHTPRAVETQTTSREPASWLEPLAALFRRPVVGFSLAAALLLAIALSAWTTIQNRRLRNQIAQLEAQKTPEQPPDLQKQIAAERQRSAALAEELSREQELRASAEKNLEEAREQAQRATGPGPPPRAGLATVASFLLTPGINRSSGEGNRISVPSGASEVRLQLDLATSDYKSYRALLKTVDSQKELLSRRVLKAQTAKGGLVVTLNIPARLLTRGDYQIQLSGQTSTGQYENVDSYYFRVTE